MTNNCDVFITYVQSTINVFNTFIKVTANHHLCNEKIEFYFEEPVFDGQYSNECYQKRIAEALNQYFGTVYVIKCVIRGLVCTYSFLENVWRRKNRFSEGADIRHTYRQSKSAKRDFLCHNFAQAVNTD